MVLAHEREARHNNRTAETSKAIGRHAPKKKIGKKKNSINPSIFAHGGEWRAKWHPDRYYDDDDEADVTLGTRRDRVMRPRKSK